jgi:stress-induced morphogen
MEKSKIEIANEKFEGMSAVEKRKMVARDVIGLVQSRKIIV